jgi:sortase A
VTCGTIRFVRRGRVWIPVAAAVLWFTAGASLGSGEIQRGREASFLTFQATPPETVPTTTTTTTTAPPPPPPSTTAAPRTERAPSTTPAPRTPTAPTTPTPPVARQSSYSPPVVGRLIIPSIGLDVTVYDGGDLAQIDFGPSHMPDTAYPGKQGNTVFAGHRVTNTHPFRDIGEVGPGDTATFVVPSGTYTYEWTSTDVIVPEQTSILEQPEAFTATLFACHPPGSDKYRIVTHWRMLNAPPVTKAPPPPKARKVGTLPGR